MSAKQTYAALAVFACVLLLERNCYTYHLSACVGDIEGAENKQNKRCDYSLRMCCGRVALMVCLCGYIGTQVDLRGGEL